MATNFFEPITGAFDAFHISLKKIQENSKIDLMLINRIWD